MKLVWQSKKNMLYNLYKDNIVGNMQNFAQKYKKLIKMTLLSEIYKASLYKICANLVFI